MKTVIVREKKKEFVDDEKKVCINKEFNAHMRDSTI